MKTITNKPKYLLNNKKNYFAGGAFADTFSAMAPQLINQLFANQNQNKQLSTETQFQNDKKQAIRGEISSKLMQTGDPLTMGIGAAVQLGGSASDAINKENCFPDPVSGELKCIDANNKKERALMNTLDPLNSVMALGEFKGRGKLKRGFTALAAATPIGALAGIKDPREVQRQKEYDLAMRRQVQADTISANQQRIQSNNLRLQNQFAQNMMSPLQSQGFYAKQGGLLSKLKNIKN
jgi:hypothetical protein